MNADLRKKIVDWHKARFPDVSPETMLLKVGEESGEVMSAHVGLTGIKDTSWDDLAGEIADVLICYVAYVERGTPLTWGEIIEQVEKKMIKLTTPGAHRASLPLYP